MSERRDITVAGAGIGGLFAAINLSKAGFHVTVLERTETFENVGAGIQLTPNAVRLLEPLGLGPAIAKVTSAPEQLVIRSGRSGRKIASLPLGQSARERYGAPYTILHRADLHNVLRLAAEQAAGIDVVMGIQAEDVTFHPRGVTLMCRRDQRLEEIQTGGLIAADGVRSRLRERIAGKSVLRYPGKVAWRAMLPATSGVAAANANHVGLWLGHDAHVVHYPIRGGKLINLVIVLRELGRIEGWSEPGERSELASILSGWSSQVRALIDAAPAFQRWTLADHSPLRQWGRGPVTLLGDAAHPMLPFIAQGGGMAIEDGAVLANCLSRHTDIETAFRAYEKARMPRTARVQREARRNNLIYHLPQPFALARDLTMQALGGSRLRKRLDWLYGWTP